MHLKGGKFDVVFLRDSVGNRPDSSNDSHFEWYLTPLVLPWSVMLAHKRGSTQREFIAVHHRAVRITERGDEETFRICQIDKDTLGKYVTLRSQRGLERAHS